MNQYLEKIAANRLKSYLISQGADFGDSRFGGASNASIMASYNMSQPTGSFNLGEKKRSFFKPFSTATKPTTATRITGDVLVSGPNMQSRLNTYNASGNRFLRSATRFVKKNPVMSGLMAGGAVLGGMGIKNMMSKPSYEQNNNGNQGYYG